MLKVFLVTMAEMEARWATQRVLDKICERDLIVHVRTWRFRSQHLLFVISQHCSSLSAQIFGRFSLGWLLISVPVVKPPLFPAVRYFSNSTREPQLEPICLKQMSGNVRFILELNPPGLGPNIILPHCWKPHSHLKNVHPVFHLWCVQGPHGCIQMGLVFFNSQLTRRLTDLLYLEFEMRNWEQGPKAWLPGQRHRSKSLILPSFVAVRKCSFSFCWRQRVSNLGWTFLRRTCFFIGRRKEKHTSEISLCKRSCCNTSDCQMPQPLSPRQQLGVNAGKRMQQLPQTTQTHWKTRPFQIKAHLESCWEALRSFRTSLHQHVLFFVYPQQMFDVILTWTLNHKRKRERSKSTELQPACFQPRDEGLKRPWPALNTH